MRRNISANIVSIGSMRIAEVREEEKKVVLLVMVVEQEDDVEVEWLSGGPFHLSEDDDRAGRIASPSVIHRDLITARTETRARLDVAFSPSRLSQRCYHTSRSYHDGREASAKSASSCFVS